jgi:hypothetical protein
MLLDEAAQDELRVAVDAAVLPVAADRGPALLVQVEIEARQHHRPAGRREIVARSRAVAGIEPGRPGCDDRPRRRILFKTLPLASMAAFRRTAGSIAPRSARISGQAHARCGRNRA